MKRQLFMLFLACVFGNASITTTGKKKRLRTTTASYYISNWSEFSMPLEINGDKLKEIMTNVAKFRRLEYCPYKEKEACKKSEIKEIVTQIIANAVKVSENNENAYNPNDEPTNETARYRREIEKMNVNHDSTTGKGSNDTKAVVLREPNDIIPSSTDIPTLFTWFRPKG